MFSLLQNELLCNYYNFLLRCYDTIGCLLINNDTAVVINNSYIYYAVIVSESIINELKCTIGHSCIRLLILLFSLLSDVFFSKTFSKRKCGSTILK